ncbi:MAG: methyltransferase domain-containing protein [Candidatus Binataceae bacterium]
MSAQTHSSTPRALDRRTLEHDHRRLAAVLRPGMSVLDAGCGTGAITVGIARAVGSRGRVVGLDRDSALLAIARARFGQVPGLSFEHGDVLAMPAEPRFDVVTAARALQWIDQPGIALGRMKAAAKPGGLVMVLDYSHARLEWEPAPGAAVRRFYDAFLTWRAANRWDNLLADHLPELFAANGLAGIVTHVEDEFAQRGDPGFDAALDIWGAVIDTVGPAIVAAGFLTESERAGAREAHARWCRDDAVRQRMVLRAVEGRPGPGA